MSADAQTAWVMQLYALEHHDGRHMLHLTKELLGDATEGVLSVVLPVTPAAAVVGFVHRNTEVVFDRGFDFAVVVRTFAGYLLDQPVSSHGTSTTPERSIEARFGVTERPQYGNPLAVSIRPIQLKMLQICGRLRSDET